LACSVRHLLDTVKQSEKTDEKCIVDIDMDTNETFDQLVKKLSSEERREMLSRISRSFETISTPIHRLDETTEFDSERAFTELPWWQKIWILVAGLFGVRSRTEMISDLYMTKIAAVIRSRSGEIIDFRRRVFLPPFRDALQSLDTALQPLRSLLDGVSGQYRTQFIVYLAAMRITLEHQDLLQLTDSRTIAATAAGNEASLRKQLKQEIEHRLGEIPKRSRLEMHSALRTIDLLHQLCRISFAGLVACFESGPGSGEGECPFDYARRSIESIAAVVTGLTGLIDPLTMEAVILFSGANEAENLSPEELANWVHTEMDHLKESVSAVREAVRTLSLVGVLQIISKDLGYEVSPASGGEDWFVVYRRYFHERITRRITEYQTQSRFLVISREAAELLQRNLKGAPGYPRSVGGIDIRYYWSAGFLHACSETVFRSVLPVLKAVLDQGDFYKAGNRAQFNDSFSELVAFRSRWTEFADSLAHDPLKEGEGLKKAVGQVEERFLQLRTKIYASAEMMANLLNGILYARPGSTYDTLTNYGQIGGRRNADFIEELKTIHEKIAGAVHLLQEIYAIESRAIELNLVLTGG